MKHSKILVSLSVIALSLSALAGCAKDAATETSAAPGTTQTGLPIAEWTEQVCPEVTGFVLKHSGSLLPPPEFSSEDDTVPAAEFEDAISWLNKYEDLNVSAKQILQIPLEERFETLRSGFAFSAELSDWKVGMASALRDKMNSLNEEDAKIFWDETIVVSLNSDQLAALMPTPLPTRPDVSDTELNAELDAFESAVKKQPYCENAMNMFLAMVQ